LASANAGNGNSIAMSGVAVGPGGEVYVAGYHQGDNLVVDGQTLTNPSGGCFVTRFSASGAAEWTRIFRSCRITAIDALPDGRPIVVGDMFQGADFGVGHYGIPTGVQAGFAMRLSSTGTTEWARRIGAGSGRTDLTHVLVANPTMAIIAGTFVNELEFDVGTISAGPIVGDSFVTTLGYVSD
jgi:hypothetical protein